MAKILLANILKKRKLSKRQFAKQLNMRYSNVFRFFHKGYDPKLSMLQKWARVLKLKVHDLYKED